jgi:hypothetical protein
MQFITNFTIKTFLKNVSSECMKCYFRDPNFILILYRSYTILGEGKERMGPLAILPHPD